MYPNDGKIEYIYNTGAWGLFIYGCMSGDLNMVMCVMHESECAHVSPWECIVCACM